MAVHIDENTCIELILQKNLSHFLEEFNKKILASISFPVIISTFFPLLPKIKQIDIWKYQWQLIKPRVK